MRLQVLDKLIPPTRGTSAERAAYLALAGAVCAALVSIAASEILLAASIAAATWTAWTARGWSRPRPGVVLPFLAFFAWTLLSALLSPDALWALRISKKFWLFSIILLVPAFASVPGAVLWTYRGVFVVAAVASSKGVSQFIENPQRDWMHRISGFMSHWMTYSGLLMLVLVALAAYGACLGWRKCLWLWPVAALVAIPLYLAQTRNAWLGAVTGLLVVLAIRRPRSILVLLPALLALYLVSPARIQSRLRAGVDPGDPNTRNRIELFQTSMRMIAEHPWFGVGPNHVPREALRHRGTSEFPDWLYQHMHNNILQIAAERGLPCAAIWLWLMGKWTLDAWRVLRQYRVAPAAGGDDPSGKEALMAATAALGCVGALLTSGMFEYNWGDSEILILFLFIESAPCAAAAATSTGAGNGTRRTT